MKTLIIQDAKGTFSIQNVDVTSAESIEQFKSNYALTDIVSLVDNQNYSKTVQEFLDEFCTELDTVESDTETIETTAESTVIETTESIADSTTPSDTPLPNHTILAKLNPSKRKPEVVNADSLIDFDDSIKIYGIGTTEFKPLEWSIVKCLLTDDLFETPFLFSRGKASLTQARRGKLEAIAGRSLDDDYIETVYTNTPDGTWTTFKVSLDYQEKRKESQNTDEMDEIADLRIPPKPEPQPLPDISKSPYEEKLPDFGDAFVASNMVVPEQVLPDGRVETPSPEMNESLFNTVPNETQAESVPDFTVDIPITAFGVPTTQDTVVEPIHDPFGIPDGNALELKDTRLQLTQYQTELAQLQNQLNDANDKINKALATIDNTTAVITQLSPVLPDNIRTLVDSVATLQAPTAEGRTLLILQIGDAARGNTNGLHDAILNLATTLRETPNASELYLQIVRYLTIL